MNVRSAVKRTKIFYFAIVIFSLLEPAPNNTVQAYNKTLLHSITTLLNTTLESYEKLLRPNFYERGSPVVVTVDMSVRSMGPISEKDMEFSMNCYFRQRWFDERLTFVKTDQLKELKLNAKFLNDIWKPDTYFLNGRKSYHHELTMPNTLVRVRFDGQVYVSQRLTIKTRCPMYLKKFPMDSQACLVELGSLGHTVEDLVFVWKGVPQVDSISLSQYQLVDTISSHKNVSSVRNPEDKVSTLSVYFQLKREQGYYLLQLYTPCTLIVVMSWVSFWLNKEASPARVALGVMTVLSMSTMGLGGRTDLPRVSYSTALDTYIVACFGFVFFALVEYAVINFAHFIHIKKVVRRLRAASISLTAPSAVNPEGPNVDLLLCRSTTDDGQTIQETAQVLRRRRSIKHSCAQSFRSTFCCCFSQSKKSPSNAVEEPEYEFMTTASGHYGGVKRRKRSSIFVGGARRQAEEHDPNTGVDWIDNTSKVLFPASYVLFNILYWLAYLYWIPDEIYAIPALKEKLERASVVIDTKINAAPIPINLTNLFDDTLNSSLV